jgi:hypothetical protein
VIFEFIRNEFPIGERNFTGLRGMYFEQLNDETKEAIWAFQYPVDDGQEPPDEPPPTRRHVPLLIKPEF